MDENNRRIMSNHSDDEENNLTGRPMASTTEDSAKEDLGSDSRTPSSTEGIDQTRVLDQNRSDDNSCTPAEMFLSITDIESIVIRRLCKLLTICPHVGAIIKDADNAVRNDMRKIVVYPGHIIDFFGQKDFTNHTNWRSVLRDGHKYVNEFRLLQLIREHKYELYALIPDQMTWELLVARAMLEIYTSGIHIRKVATKIQIPTSHEIIVPTDTEYTNGLCKIPSFHTFIRQRTIHSDFRKRKQMGSQTPVLKTKYRHPNRLFLTDEAPATHQQDYSFTRSINDSAARITYQERGGYNTCIVKYSSYDYDYVQVHWKQAEHAHDYVVFEIRHVHLIGPSMIDIYTRYIGEDDVIDIDRIYDDDITYIDNCTTQYFNEGLLKDEIWVSVIRADGTNHEISTDSDYTCGERRGISIYCGNRRIAHMEEAHDRDWIDLGSTDLERTDMACSPFHLDMLLLFKTIRFTMRIRYLLHQMGIQIQGTIPIIGNFYDYVKMSTLMNYLDHIKDTSTSLVTPTPNFSARNLCEFLEFEFTDEHLEYIQYPQWEYIIEALINNLFVVTTIRPSQVNSKAKYLSHNKPLEAQGRRIYEDTTVALQLVNNFRLQAFRGTLAQNCLFYYRITDTIRREIRNEARKGATFVDRPIQAPYQLDIVRDPINIQYVRGNTYLNSRYEWIQTITVPRIDPTTLQDVHDGQTDIYRTYFDLFYDIYPLDPKGQRIIERGDTPTSASTSASAPMDITSSDPNDTLVSRLCAEELCALNTTMEEAMGFVQPVGMLFSLLHQSQ